MENPTRYKVDTYSMMIVDTKNHVEVCSISGAKLYFGKKKGALKNKISKLNIEIAKLVAEREKLKEKCRHSNAVHEYKANTGNYDPTCDKYWIECRCYDCGKFWDMEQ